MPYSDEPVHIVEGTVQPTQEVEPSESKQETGKSKDERLSDMLNGQAMEIAKAQVMAQFVADPEIRAILEARQTGKKVQVHEETRESSLDATKEEEVNWDELSNSQLVQKLPSKILGPLQQTIQELLNPLQQEVQTLRAQLQQTEGEKVKSKIETLKSQNPDFEARRATMIALNNEFGGKVPPEELLVLARVRDKAPLVPPKPPATERPTSNSARPNISARNGNRQFLGQRGMSELLNAALAEKDFSDYSDTNLE